MNRQPIHKMHLILGDGNKQSAHSSGFKNPQKVGSSSGQFTIVYYALLMNRQTLSHHFIWLWVLLGTAKKG